MRICVIGIEVPHPNVNCFTWNDPLPYLPDYDLSIIDAAALAEQGDRVPPAALNRIRYGIEKVMRNAARDTRVIGLFVAPKVLSESPTQRITTWSWCPIPFRVTQGRGEIVSCLDENYSAYLSLLNGWRYRLDPPTDTSTQAWLNLSHRTLAESRAKDVLALESFYGNHLFDAIKALATIIGNTPTAEPLPHTKPNGSLVLLPSVSTNRAEAIGVLLHSLEHGQATETQSGLKTSLNLPADRRHEVTNGGGNDMQLSEQYRGYSLSISCAGPAVDAHSCLVRIGSSDGTTVFSEKVQLTGTERVGRYANIGDDELSSKLKHLAVNRAKARLDMGSFVQGEEYTFDVGAQEDSSEVSDTEVSYWYLKMLDTIRRAMPKHYRYHVAPVDGLCSHLSITTSGFQYIASLLVERGHIERLPWDQSTTHFITARGIEHLVELENTRKADIKGEVFSTVSDRRKVFIIHGRNSKVVESMFTFLQALQLWPIEWSEARKMTGKGSPHISDILDAAFRNAQAVIALFTPDDEVRLKQEFWNEHDGPDEKELRGQSRPNVLFEAGLAFGRCEERTILVRVGDVKWFSDIAGRHFIRLDNDQAARNNLASALEAVGCPVDRSGNRWLHAGDFSIAHATTMVPTTTKQPDSFSEILIAFHELTGGGRTFISKECLLENGITVQALAKFIPHAESRGWLSSAGGHDGDYWSLTRIGILQSEAVLAERE